MLPLFPPPTGRPLPPPVSHFPHPTPIPPPGHCCAGKEYSKADSRYASRDSFIISMEAITAFLWGPLCPLLVWGIFTARPWRYTLMVVVSVGQIYGDVLYYGTCFLEGESGGGGGGGGVGAAYKRDPLLSRVGVSCLSPQQIIAVIERRVY